MTSSGPCRFITSDIIFDKNLGLEYFGPYRLPVMTSDEQTLIWEKNYCAPGNCELPPDSIWNYGWDVVRQVEAVLNLGFDTEVVTDWDYVLTYDITNDFLDATVGYPWLRYLQTKRDLTWDQMTRAADELGESLESGLRPVIYQLFPKIELAKQEKIETHDQRMICGSPFDNSLLGKKTLVPYVTPSKTPHVSWTLYGWYNATIVTLDYVGSSQTIPWWRCHQVHGV